MPAGTSEHSIVFGGLERTYRVYRPASLSAAEPVPLVVMLHGALGTGRQAEEAYGWNAQADEGGFVVAYPDGIKRSWAVSEGCCGPPAKQRVDDVGFIKKLVAGISAKLPIDQARIYATGISNGGMLAYRLACDTTLFAAIGAVAATQVGPCPTAQPTSVLHLHGTADRTIPYGGGPGKRDNDGTGEQPAKIDGPPVPALLATWRQAGDCAVPTTRKSGPVTTTTAGCPKGRGVELITIEGAGHQWPQSKRNLTAERLFRLDPPSPAVNATGTLWAFFTKHPKPA